MTKHSVAPWRDETGTIFAADDMVVCEIMGGDGQRFIDDEDNAECLANKRLILAAPAMLKALQRIAALKWGHDGDCGADRIAHDAIGLATDEID